MFNLKYFIVENKLCYGFEQSIINNISKIWCAGTGITYYVPKNKTFDSVEELEKYLEKEGF